MIKSFVLYIVAFIAVCFVVGCSVDAVDTYDSQVEKVEVALCNPDCTGRQCGLDPICGLTCGTCSTGKTCVDNQCVSTCVPDCTGRQCGLDPICGVSCGSCPRRRRCNLNTATCRR